MTIQQVIDIPADRRVVFDLPETVPTGQSSVQLIFTSITAAMQPETSPQEAPPHLVQNHNKAPLDLNEARIHISAADMQQNKSGNSSRKFAGCLKGKNIFKGDPVAIQRKMRDAW